MDFFYSRIYEDKLKKISNIKIIYYYSKLNIIRIKILY